MLPPEQPPVLAPFEPVALKVVNPPACEFPATSREEKPLNIEQFVTPEKV